MTKKIDKIDKKITDNDHTNKCIATQEFSSLLWKSITARLAPVNLATKADITDLLKKADFDDKLKTLNKKVISRKSKHADAEKKSKWSKK